MEFFLGASLVLLNLVFFSSSSLTKKGLSFIFCVGLSGVLLPGWVSMLLLLLYIGGLFIVVTYIITFSWFQEKASLLFCGSALLLSSEKLAPFLSDPGAFYEFAPLISQFWVVAPLLLLVGGMFLISSASPSSKSIRGGI